MVLMKSNEPEECVSGRDEIDEYNDSILNPKAVPRVYYDRPHAFVVKSDHPKAGHASLNAVKNFKRYLQPLRC